MHFAAQLFAQHAEKALLRFRRPAPRGERRDGVVEAVVIIGNPFGVANEKTTENANTVGSSYVTGDSATLVFAIKDEEVSDYHYCRYNAVESLTARSWPPETQESFFRVLREELSSEVHGEVDEKSWHLKQGLLRRQTNIRRETKLFREYAAQSFEDTLTLYLHGICCDIDVETGPRQMPSRYLRKRLELLHSLYPPPDGYAVFPEELKRR